jgi:hypothetical protein
VSDAGEDRLHVEGELEVAGERVPLRLDPTIHETDRQLEIEAATTVDQRLLGMTFEPTRNHQGHPHRSRAPAARGMSTETNHPAQNRPEVQ